MSARPPVVRPVVPAAKEQAAQAAALDLLSRVGPLGPREVVCVSAEADGVACEVRLRPARVRRGRGGAAVERCKQDILEMMSRRTEPLTSKQVRPALAAAGYRHKPGAIALALAALTGEKRLVNLRDWTGYYLPEWLDRRRQPGLFDACEETCETTSPPFA